MKYPLNQILYGPPGTGKTYNTICYALAIVKDKPVEEIRRRMEEDREEVMEEYRRCVRSGWIAFTTFHQSMGYEEFIEGIKPEADGNGNVTYSVKAGIFKQFCDRAKILRSSLTDSKYFFSGSPTVWKVSLAGTGNNPVRQECFEHNHIRIGWDEIRQGCHRGYGISQRREIHSRCLYQHHAARGYCPFLLFCGRDRRHRRCDGRL